MTKNLLLLNPGKGVEAEPLICIEHHAPLAGPVTRLILEQVGGDRRHRTILQAFGPLRDGVIAEGHPLPRWEARVAPFHRQLDEVRPTEAGVRVGGNTGRAVPYSGGTEKRDFPVV